MLTRLEVTVCGERTRTSEGEKRTTLWLMLSSRGLSLDCEICFWVSHRKINARFQMRVIKKKENLEVYVTDLY